MNQREAMIGCLLGTAVGDAIALPMEGLSPRRQARLFPRLETHYFLGKRGMLSDDTEQTCMVAQSLIVAAGDVEVFRRALAWRLRWWWLGLPAGIGKATLIAIARLWLGVAPTRSGVFSAGNGAAMRSAILGLCCESDRLREFVRASTRITHTDPKAEWGALAVALAAKLASRGRVEPETYARVLQQELPPEAAEFVRRMNAAIASAVAGETAAEFMRGRRIIPVRRWEEYSDLLPDKGSSNLSTPGWVAFFFRTGISGYVYETVPAVVQVWLRYQSDYRAGIVEIVRLGGDTDTTAAILGGIIGAGVGAEGIPLAWRQGLWDYPRSRVWIEALGDRLFAAGNGAGDRSPLPLFIPAILPRNLLFLAIVLGHGFRRLLPPY